VADAVKSCFGWPIIIPATVAGLLPDGALIVAAANNSAG
jgi:hypothetical protein